MRFAICVLLLFGVALSGACTVDSDVTSAGCPSGVNVGEPTRDPPVVAGDGPPGDRPLDARDPCAPVTMAPKGKKAQCRVYWPRNDEFTHWYSTPENPPKNLTHAQAMCTSEMWEKGADRCNGCVWVDANKSPTNPGPTDESVECTVRKTIEGGTETLDTWHSTDDSLTEAEYVCDEYYGWPESGTKCSGCRWMNGPGSAANYCSGDIACTDSARPPPNVGGCTFDNRQIEEVSEVDARHRAIFQCLQMTIAKHGPGQWSCESRDLRCVAGADAPNGATIVHELDATTWRCTTEGWCTIGSARQGYRIIKTWEQTTEPAAIASSEDLFRRTCADIRGPGTGVPEIDSTLCWPER